MGSGNQQREEKEDKLIADGVITERERSVSNTETRGSCRGFTEVTGTCVVLEGMQHSKVFVGVSDTATEDFAGDCFTGVVRSQIPMK